MNSHFSRRTCALVLAATAVAIPPMDSLAETPAARVLARVDSEAITQGDVDREIAVAFPNRTIEPATREVVQRQIMELLIRRQLVLRYLRETRQSASSADVDLAIERLKKQLTQQEITFEGYLQSKQLDEGGLRRILTWQIGWRRLLDKYLTEANLKSYFDKHPREFDGTELRVAHILFPVDKTANTEERAVVRKTASSVLARLRTGEIEFQEAAKLYSSSPSREAGGDIGWIGRREPMPESFSQAAFGLQINQISDPVETVFGFHLIRCADIKPGSKTWSDVRGELEQAVTQYLFDWAADQMQSTAKIERTL